MTAVLAAFALGALAAPFLARRLGRGVFPLAALVPAAAFVHALTALPVVLAGGTVTEVIPWVPQLGLALSFRVDALALLLVLVVTGVGALVFVYCAAYFRRGDAGVGRFAGILLAFAGSMYGLVLADDVYLLFAFWEATSVFSYLLIGHNRTKRASRTAALQALLVTTLGGLVMLVGLVLLAQLGGSTSLAELVAHPPTAEPALPIAVALILVGVLSKSAIVPFHFWLPGAMAAPTPVSAYLHAAAMVKAGIYLAARLAPGYADVPGWRELLVGLGLVTLLVGAVRAVKQTDLKLVLAHGTVSQLGLLAVIAGWGGAAGGVAAVLLLLAHALFKSALFLIVGVVDHGCGTRDLRRITGFGRRAPLLAAAAGAAVLSMAGLPIALGFVAKESLLTVLVDVGADGDPWGWIALGGVVLGSAFTIAYGTRFVWGAFADKAGVEPLPAEPSYPRLETWALFAPPVALAALGLVAGPLAGLLDPLAQRLAAGYADPEIEHVAFWHGLQPALGFSALVLALGVVLALRLARRRPAEAPATDAGLGDRAYRGVVRGIDVVAARVTGLTQRGSLPFYLAVILFVAVAAVWSVLPAAGLPARIDLLQHPAQPVVGALMIVAAIGATLAAKRFQAVVLVGVTGVGMATLFVVQGAPDLALTQVLVELVTLVAVVLVLRRLPARLGEKHGSSHRVLRAALGIAVGVTMAVVAIIATGSRVATPVSESWPELAVEEGHGYNVVNVAIVDIRGWDTMGELTVVIAAATGVASLIFLRTRADDLPRSSRRTQRSTFRDRRAAAVSEEVPAGRGSWLLAGRTLAPHNRSILLEVVVRLLFHALILVSLYLLLVGHNAVGGGFAGGLVAGLALVARYLAGGRVELGAAAPFDAGRTLGVGLALAAGAAAVPLLFGLAPLTSGWVTLDLGPLGDLDVVSATVFDIGVYLVVIGLVLDVLRSLGAELDRELESGDAVAAKGVRA